MHSLNRSLRFVAAIWLAHALSACGGASDGAAAPRAAAAASSTAASATTSATPSAKADGEVRFAP